LDVLKWGDYTSKILACHPYFKKNKDFFSFHKAVTDFFLSPQIHLMNLEAFA